MSSDPRSWTAGIVGFALAVLVACWALQLAAGLLLDALPILGPVAGLVVVGWAGWRYVNRPRGW
ncbi:hypothetical protein FHU33_1068 [Blastococcus colisei]|uniref:Uncharacterized protein n=1 Tax=Blastococcus colisei TaxID=1564162 RepID=A0A543PC84_9ACTN|nr:hypothetical protein [Blastococcus colisei]TQN41691.1 hypothetical protein FHU33_1068 [Blastococcus colisei]